VTLLNDWSARDLQAWEYQPLGPFLAKNFASTLSPWIVTMEALAPFRAKFERPAGDPQPLPYLDAPSNREAARSTSRSKCCCRPRRCAPKAIAPARLTRGNTTEAAYWTAAQLITHHTVNGCNLQPGDLLGSGTLSGPKPDEAGSLMELTLGGKQAITLPNGEKRTFLEDGDTLVMRGYCERAGAVRIGLGEVSGTVAGLRLPCCPLSLWERARVRALGLTTSRGLDGRSPSPQPSPQGEREQEVQGAGAASPPPATPLRSPRAACPSAPALPVLMAAMSASLGYWSSSQ
jgi:2-keto-4-pentenoate hydratase/2-oxohepta-3-ene-1,7-dioic acid hydratase in catechol pathway